MLLSTSISRRSRDYFFMSELKSNSVSNSKTTGTAATQHPYTCTPWRSKLEQPLFLKAKKKKNYLLTLPLPASINGTAIHACAVRKFNLA
jgi:hypothetical protein